jgi:hypothetical protein
LPVFAVCHAFQKKMIGIATVRFFWITVVWSRGMGGKGEKAEFVAFYKN